MAAGISSHINIRSAAPSVMRQDEAAIGIMQRCICDKQLSPRRTESQEQ